ncbi:hypothetical protein AB0A77_15510 [Streptomyces varsoviensis]|uniref:hypothetical protein n=1 Tax=Streptomyces varsoviensis TaxID=67373 RepID=UPI00340961C3
MAEGGEGLPLFGVEGDVVALAGAAGGATAAGRKVLDGFGYVRSRVVAEDLRLSDGSRQGVVPAVSVLDPRVEPVLRDRIQTVVRCLRELVRRYAGDGRLRDFLDVPEALDRWVRAEPAPERLEVDWCRPDLLGETLGTVRVLEFNASSPGGMLNMGMLTRFWRESAFGRVLEEWGVPPAPLESPTWFADWLLDYGQTHGVARRAGRQVGLFHTRGRFEFAQMARQLRDRGQRPVLLSPGAPDGDELRLGYLKYIPLAPDDVRGWEAFCARACDGDLVIPNALAARWVAENKLCLAALSDPRFRYLFAQRECAALDALVPFSRKLGDGITAADAIAERERLVLKAPYSCRGESVVMGVDTPPALWKRTVRDAAHQGWLVQERVAAGIIETADGPFLRDLVAPMLRGRVIGYGGRFSSEHLLNAAQGGRGAVVLSPWALAPVS